ncbi:amino acid ABC transporter permease [Thermoflexus hugenholtzii]|uniref:Putative glutamine transport system permease protein n=1 Tax=Thermoflexus hugenholtzii JAD2 TaxID=877466 RepID=A0A212QQY8_9CHLR|nr:amino acid ABC transporter permease [Thermoflexus hugenholtzii]SNB61891.1 putative glutamine transport system permease protein [Thermoflexus hugenholtzii JAD2]
MQASERPWQTLAGVGIVLALIPLAFRMEPARFAPFLEGSTWRFLALGLLLTLEASAIAILASIPLALFFALARLSGPFWLRYPVIALVEGIRALPLLGLMFYLFLRLSALGRQLGMEALTRPDAAVIAALWLYTGAVNGEALRAAILSLPRGQWEAARSLGLTYGQAMRLVILPQAFRRALPPLVAQFATLVKDTSLGAIIGFIELYRRGVILFQGERNPMETLYVISVIYFLVNYTLGRLAGTLERRLGLHRG